MGLAMRLVAGRDLRLEVAVLGLDDLVGALAPVLELAGSPSWRQVMVFMGGKLRLIGRASFSNPDRLAVPPCTSSAGDGRASLRGPDEQA